MKFEKYPLICNKCGKNFLGDKPTRKYCSQECAGNNPSKITVNCLYCNTPFTVIKKRKGTAGWCSRICYDSYRQIIKEAQPHFKTPINLLPQLHMPAPENFHSNRKKNMKRGTAVLCKRCGINTMPFSPRRKYCDTCKEKVNREQSEIRRRKHGVLPFKHSPFQQLRGESCQICGWNDSTCDRHHIIPRKEGGKDDLDNIIVLCPNHHRLADFGILSKQDLFRIKDFYL